MEYKFGVLDSWEDCIRAWSCVDCFMLEYEVYLSVFDHLLIYYLCIYSFYQCFHFIFFICHGLLTSLRSACFVVEFSVCSPFIIVTIHLFKIEFSVSMKTVSCFTNYISRYYVCIYWHGPG